MKAAVWGCLLAVMGGLALQGQTTPMLPSPTGRFPIGVRYLALVDPRRAEPFSRDPSARREVTVQVWYPATPDPDSKPAPYLLGAGAVVKPFGLPPSHANLVAHAGLNAALVRSTSPLPVLIFNHGWGEHFAQNSILMEELASHGYIVFSVAHHYEAKFSFRPDGRPILMDESSPRFQQIMREQGNPDAQALFAKMLSARSDAERRDVSRATTTMLSTLLIESTRLWVQDIRFVVHELERLNRTDPTFKGMLALDRLGVFGMSLGGLAAAQACVVDGRIRAGANLDGGIYGDLLDRTIPQPFLFVSSARYLGFESWFLSHVDRVGAAVTVRGSDHYDFHDATVLDRQHAMLGSIDGRRMATLLNDIVLAFFDDTLSGVRPARFETTAQRYQELVVQTKGRAGQRSDPRRLERRNPD